MATASKAFPNRSWVVLHVSATAGTPNPATNQTPISYSVWVYGTNYGGFYYLWPNAGNRLEFWIDGVRIDYREHLQFDFRGSNPTTQNLFSGTTNVTHNSDGSKAITVEARYVDSTSYPVLKDNNCSVGMTLATIPRATTITSFSAFTSDSSSISVNLSRKSSSFTHEIALKIGSTTVASWSGAAANFNGAGTLALTTAQKNALLDALPSSLSATATLVVTTKSGSTTIGSDSKTATYTIAANIKPTATINSISTSNPVGNITGNTADSIIQNVTNVTVSSSGTPPRGTTIASIKTAIGSISSTANPATIKPGASGNNVPIIVTVTDKRGRTETVQNTEALATVIPYTQASAQILYLGRPLTGDQDTLNTQLKLNISPLTISGSTTNAYNVKITATPVGGGATITSINDTVNPGSASDLTKNYTSAETHEEMTAYTINIVIKDEYSSVTIHGAMSTATYPLVIGKYGIGIGKVPEGNRVLDIQDENNGGIFINNESLENQLDKRAPRISPLKAINANTTLTLQTSARKSYIFIMSGASNDTKYYGIYMIIVPSSSYNYIHTIFERTNGPPSFSWDSYNLKIKSTVSFYYCWLEI